MGDFSAGAAAERLVNTDKATQLSQFGICPVMAYKGQPEVRLAGLETLNGQTLELKTTGKPVPEAARPAGDMSIESVAKPEVDTAADDLSDGEPDDLVEEDVSTDDDLDDLLADFDTDEADDSDASDDDDSDLDDLLASFGDDDDDESADDDGEDEMDSDLADLFASLD